MYVLPYIYISIRGGKNIRARITSRTRQNLHPLPLAIVLYIIITIIIILLMISITPPKTVSKLIVINAILRRRKDRRKKIKTKGLLRYSL